MAESSVAMVVMNPDMGSILFLLCSTRQETSSAVMVVLS